MHGVFQRTAQRSKLDPLEHLAGKGVDEQTASLRLGNAPAAQVRERRCRRGHGGAILASSGRRVNASVVERIQAVDEAVGVEALELAGPTHHSSIRPTASPSLLQPGNARFVPSRRNGSTVGQVIRTTHDWLTSLARDSLAARGR